MAVTPSPPLQFTKNRLRQRVIEESFMNDTDLLTVLDDAYQAALTESAANVAYVTLTLEEGTAEYALPANWARTLHVYGNGRALEYTADRHSLRANGNGFLQGYYQSEGIIGFNPVPSDGDTVVVLYALAADRLTSYDDDLVPAFTPEWHHALRHYAAFQALVLSGGAQRMGEALNEKAEYDHAVVGLRNSARLVARDRIEPLRTVETFRRKPWRLDPSVDAR